MRPLANGPRAKGRINVGVFGWPTDVSKFLSPACRPPISSPAASIDASCWKERWPHLAPSQPPRPADSRSSFAALGPRIRARLRAARAPRFGHSVLQRASATTGCSRSGRSAPRRWLSYIARPRKRLSVRHSTTAALRAFSLRGHVQPHAHKRRRYCGGPASSRVYCGHDLSRTLQVSLLSRAIAAIGLRGFTWPGPGSTMPGSTWIPLNVSPTTIGRQSWQHRSSACNAALWIMCRRRLTTLSTPLRPRSFAEIRG